MNSSCKASAAVALAAIFSCHGGGCVRADLVGITYYDQGFVNPETSGGPLWMGVVDTVTNNLRIDDWLELPGHGADFWVPANLPMVWGARNSNGEEYDVPATFGTTVVPGPPDTLTAEIGSDFGFFSSLTLSQMAWENGTFSPQVGASIIPGWGGVALFDEGSGEFVYHTDIDASSGGTLLDETVLLYLPVSATSPNISRDATIIVTFREVTSDPIIPSVPEASAVAGLGLVSAFCLAGAWVRKKQRAFLGR